MKIFKIRFILEIWVSLRNKKRVKLATSKISYLSKGKVKKYFVYRVSKMIVVLTGCPNESTLYKVVVRHDGGDR